MLKKVLFACDELAGFITAVTYVRPSKSVDEVEVSSVKKKMKDKAFAKAVSRDDIMNGAVGINIPLDEHIDFCINAMRKNKDVVRIMKIGMEVENFQLNDQYNNKFDLV